MEYTVKGTVVERYISDNKILPCDFCAQTGIDVRTYDKIVRGVNNYTKNRSVVFATERLYFMFYFISVFISCRKFCRQHLQAQGVYIRFRSDICPKSKRKLPRRDVLPQLFLRLRERQLWT